MRFIFLLILLVSLWGCASSTPPDQYTYRCATTTRVAWKPEVHEAAKDCPPVVMNETPRINRQYYVDCPNHSYFCYRKAKIMCGEYRQLRTEPFAEPGQLLVECK